MGFLKKLGSTQPNLIDATATYQLLELEYIRIRFLCEPLLYTLLPPHDLIASKDILLGLSNSVNAMRTKLFNPKIARYVNTAELSNLTAVLQNDILFALKDIETLEKYEDSLKNKVKVKDDTKDQE